MAESSIPGEEKPPPKKPPLPIEEFLRPLLELSGIKDFSEVELYLYTQRGGGSHRFKIRTFPNFLHSLGSGSYQVAISEPVIEGLPSGPFKMTFLSVSVEYDGNNGWTIDSVVTDWEEEIFPGSTDSESLKDRATKIGKRILSVLQFLSMIKDLAGSFGPH